MKTNRFFELFGDYTFWMRGKVGREGFSVEDLYRQFKKRFNEEEFQVEMDKQMNKLDREIADLDRMFK